MMAYEGGYTSALNAASHRGSQDAYVQEAMRHLAMQAWQNQQQIAGQQQADRARAALGSAMYNLVPAPPVPGITGGNSGNVQPPMPGTQSQPMQPAGSQPTMPMPSGASG